MTEQFYNSFLYFLLVLKRLPEHVQVDDPAALKKLAKKLERQQVRQINAVLLCLFSDYHPLTEDGFIQVFSEISFAAFLTQVLPMSYRSQGKDAV